MSQANLNEAWCVLFSFVSSCEIKFGGIIVSYNM